MIILYCKLLQTIAQGCMAEYLTAKQVITLLKIDRTTLYRMLKEGRIRGVKIGSHWRFPLAMINNLIDGKTIESIPASEGANDDLPVHCVQPIQEVFSDIINLAALTTDTEGNPITEISNSCNFCKLIYNSEKGKAACIKSWMSLRFSHNNNTVFNTCHAGLNYSGSNIAIDGVDSAKIITGQFLLEPMGKEQKIKISSLADEYAIDREALLNAAEEIPVLPEVIKPQIGKWLHKIAKSFETIGSERKELIRKLREIAEISNL